MATIQRRNNSIHPTGSSRSRSSSKRLPPVRRVNILANQCCAARRGLVSIMTILILLALVLIVVLRGSITTIAKATNTDNMASPQQQQQQQDEDVDNIVILSWRHDTDTSTGNKPSLSSLGEAVEIRLHLFAEQAPLAARYIKTLASAAHHKNSSTTTLLETCRKCTLYRGEPVPSYWGSPNYPDRYFDGGRWGPPYALIQGSLLSDFNVQYSLQQQQQQVPLPPAEASHTPIVTRGMVAWAGGKGGPHFFIALADHPEWGHGHTVWAQVTDERDMIKLEALVLERPLVSTKPKRPPIVTNFVTPIPITIRMA